MKLVLVGATIFIASKPTEQAEGQFNILLIIFFMLVVYGTLKAFCGLQRRLYLGVFWRKEDCRW
ncbi:MAG: hypothetical protein KGI30_08040 [Planctomycetota bacterium]|nr:hypothetical protein [Planctomycetota bacterium]